MSDLGLPPPPARPQPAAPEPSRVPELPPGYAHDSLTRLTESSAWGTMRYADALAARAEDPSEPRYTPFKGDEPDALQAVESMLEGAVGADPSTMGMLKGLASGMWTSIDRPLATITDEYQVSKIRELQQQFLKAHAADLVGLSESLGRAKALMRELADLLDATQNLDPLKLGRLMEEKRQAGYRTLREIDGALERSTDPQERARLQAARDDLSRWMAERDGRLEREQPEVALLQARMRLLQDEIFKQKAGLREAAWSRSPSTATSGGPYNVVETTHTRPDAVEHVTSLFDYLLGTRGALNRAMNPND